MASPAQLPKAVAAKLLDKLGSDDAFRTQFQKDPVAALKEVGASEDDAKACGACLSVSKLADKATIKASSQELTAMLTAAMGYQPHKLGAR
jgi:putative modified peptide